MKNYAILDIENPNARGNSICSISILVIKNGKIIDKKYTLINPEDRFDIRNSKINGIIESMVLDKPTFKEYWGNIKGILNDNVIIGHNITYDLSVISKSLNRYDIDIPNFRYIDTLEISQKYLKLDSYNLTSISEYLNYDYEAHNAFEDTKATYNLFEYLTENFAINDDFIHRYQYLNKFDENIDEKLSTNINELYGIIQGINYDNIINDKEIDLLRNWINNNLIYKQYSLFNNIINSLNRILEDNIIDKYERIELMNLVTAVSRSKIYNDTTLNLQVLQGIINGISCDGEIVIDEINNLKTWLDINNHLAGIYPYDKVFEIVNSVLEDGILTEEEKNELSVSFQEILNPILESRSSISLLDKTFCLTGEFKNGSKSEIKSKLEKLGGIEKKGISSKLDYLFVGELGSEAWKFGKIGGKIAKAQELQEKGINIEIISESDLIKILEDDQITSCPIS